MKEVNFDGLAGPTHNYGGLSFGNIASQKHKSMVSNPKAAALQGLEKMYALHKLGIKQGILPPHERPNLPFLNSLGFYGTEEQILAKAYREAPDLLAASCSAACMWAANAATVCPSQDSLDGQVHMTPANLCSNAHRSIEPKTTAALLKKIFPFAAHHAPLPSTDRFSDEGAANHTRFANGVQLFVFGKKEKLKKYPARQTLDAGQAIARLHRLDPAKTLFAEQNPEAIDAGVFHNDVISVGFENLFFYHERAFLHTEKTVDELEKKIPNFTGIRVNEHDISLDQAVNTYLFNSQIVRDRANRLLLIAPVECREEPRVFAFLNKAPFDEVLYFDLRQSMQNGGGPACLRLRVLLNEEERAKTHQKVFLSDELYQQLKDWISLHYRDKLIFDDLKDPQLLNESRQALDALTKLLDLGPLYDFQK